LSQSTPTNIIASAIKGLASGITSVALGYGLEKAGLSPLQGALLSRAITSAIEGFWTGNPFKGITDSVLNLATFGLGNNNYNNLSSWDQATYLAKVQDFSSIIRRDGLTKALETYATSIFHRDSVESIVNTFGSVSNYIQKSIADNKATPTTIQGKAAFRVSLNQKNEEYLILSQDQKELLGKGVKGVYEEGTNNSTYRIRLKDALVEEYSLTYATDEFDAIIAIATFFRSSRQG